MVLCSSLIERNPAPLLITVWSGGEVVGAAFRTLNSPLMCTGLARSAVTRVVAEIAVTGSRLNAVSGPVDVASRVAAEWCSVTGVFSSVGSRDRLYRLETLVPPQNVPGVARLAESTDADLVSNWLNRFRAEALGKPVDVTLDPRHVRTAKEPPDEFLLWTVDGDPVSLAGVRLPVLGVSRVGPVYTPTGWRGLGYGSATTATAAGWALERNAEDVVLFTDPDNPASNAAYRRIGFAPVDDFTRINFTEPA
ncbi:MAG TPA: GNAT family N-acetyltransferase [Mycobacterium sp.]|nr:GNAT family N-acetyltransferase [Mycobacterium sp.]